MSLELGVPAPTVPSSVSMLTTSTASRVNEGVAPGATPPVIWAGLIMYW